MRALRGIRALTVAMLRELVEQPLVERPGAAGELRKHRARLRAALALGCTGKAVEKEIHNIGIALGELEA